MKRARNIVSKKTSGDGIMGGALLVVLTIILFIALLGLVSTPALAGGNGKHRSHPRACSKIASAAFLACENEKKDDYWIAQGNCYNLSDKEAQAECFKDAKAEYKEAKAECGDQLEARKDLCEALGEAPYDPEIDPANFDDPKPNPYFPLTLGASWTYQTKVNGTITETNTVEVADETVTIEGVECVVVHDVVYDGDEIKPENIIEDTYDWYAQDNEGNVWYFGERSLAREGCEDEAQDCDAYLLTNEGSWKTGFDEARPGKIMFADPSAEVGKVYRQEFALGDAEDVAKVLSVKASPSEEVDGYECNGTCLQTKDYTPIEPDIFEYKYYAPGVGVILEEAYENDEPTGERTELVDFH